MGFDKDVFAARLRKRRRDLELSQTALAEMAGISPDAVVKYEGGGSVPGSDKVFALALALDVSPNYLMGWSELEVCRREREAG